MLEPVRESFKTGKPMQWTRVNDLPEFVYFNHSIHVNKGVGCSTCHGRVDQHAAHLAGELAADGVVRGTAIAIRRSTCGRARRSSTWTGSRRRISSSRARGSCRRMQDPADEGVDRRARRVTGREDQPESAESDGMLRGRSGAPPRLARGARSTGGVSRSSPTRKSSASSSIASSRKRPRSGSIP